MSPYVRLVILALAAVALVALAVSILRKLRLTPAERERRRRAMISRAGRMLDGMITDFSADAIYYAYSVNGVDYTASQDLTDLREFVPSDPAQLVGLVTIKYAPRNPANSILVCESWSGFRTKNRKEISLP
jgi:hypothetical protein